MPAILRKSFTAWDAFAALPPTPSMKRRPPCSLTARSSATHFSQSAGLILATISAVSFRCCAEYDIKKSGCKGGWRRRGGSRRPRRIFQEPVELLEAGVGADLIEPLRKLAVRKERLLDLRKVHGLVAREPAKGRRLEGAEAVVDVVHGRELVLLVV